jgi:hypothetical protein
MEEVARAAVVWFLSPLDLANVEGARMGADRSHHRGGSRDTTCGVGGLPSRFPSREEAEAPPDLVTEEEARALVDLVIMEEKPDERISRWPAPPRLEEVAHTTALGAPEQRSLLIDEPILVRESRGRGERFHERGRGRWPLSYGEHRWGGRRQQQIGGGSAVARKKEDGGGAATASCGGELEGGRGVNLYVEFGMDWVVRSNGPANPI